MDPIQEHLHPPITRIVTRGIAEFDSRSFA